MFKIQLHIVHDGCWGSEIHQKFPLLTHSSVDCRWVGNRVAHILRSSGDKTFFSQIVKYLNTCHDVNMVEVLSEDDDTIFVRTLTKRSKKHFQFSNLFFDNNCFPIAPTRFVGNEEIWTLGTSKKENFTPIYDLLKKKYPLKIKSITNDKMRASLTQKQREALSYAHHFGYFEWPRKKTVTEIAKLLAIPKTVFLSHLRKAEQKIIKNHLSSK